MRWLLACALLLAASHCASGAHAQAPAERNLHLLAAFGYGPQDDSDAGSFGAAFGLKAGYVLADWVHLGAEGTFHLGTRFGDEQNRIQYYGLEVGARLAHEQVGLTPYLTSGLALVQTQRNVDPSITAMYLGLGMMIDVALNDWLLLGFDGRLVTIPSGVQQSDNRGSVSGGDLLVLAGARL